VKLVKHFFSALSAFALLSQYPDAWAQSSDGADSAGNQRAAEASAEVTRLNEAGSELYKIREYRRAVEKFIEAYAIDHDPNLLFNIARCYEQLGETEAAIEKYEQFSKMPGADTDGRQRAEESLRKLRQLLLVQGQDDPPTDAEALGQTTSPTPPIAAPRPAADSVNGEADGSSLRLWAWLSLGVGAAAAGVGTTLYLLGSADHSKVEDTQGFGSSVRVHSLTQAEAEHLVASGDTKKRLGVIGFSAAGAFVVTSALLFIFDDDPWVATENPPSAFSPRAVAFAPSDDGVRFSFSGSF
jgi:tetratricopeptide (TPR) repeat protein